MMAIKIGKPPVSSPTVPVPAEKKPAVTKPKAAKKKAQKAPKAPKAASHLLSQPQRDEKKQHNVYMWKQDIVEFKKLCALLGDQATTMHTLIEQYKEQHGIDW